MQHTETYNLNLIETTDTFSPDPLNQNAQLLEDALAAETSARTSADGALDQRVTVLEARRIVTGIYTGSSSTDYPTKFVNLGFTPKLVLCFERTLSSVMAATNTDVCYYSSQSNWILRIVENGFEVKQIPQAAGYNMNGIRYKFLAIL